MRKQPQKARPELEAAELITIPIASIVEPDQALRGPQRHDPKFAELRDNIRARGVMLPILVRRGEEPGTFVLIDGMQRYTLSKEVGFTTIPARVVQATRREALELQAVLNLHRIETTPLQYAEMLNRMLLEDPELNVPRLSARLNVSPSWVHKTLGLLHLDPRVADLLNRGKICINNAQAIAALPAADQMDYVALAQVLSPKEFRPKLAEIARRIREGVRESYNLEYAPVDHIQRMRTLKGEIESGKVRRELFNEVGPRTPEAAWKLALEWVLHRDPISIRAARAKEKKLQEDAEAIQRGLYHEARYRRTRD